MPPMKVEGIMFAEGEESKFKFRKSSMENYF